MYEKVLDTGWTEKTSNELSNAKVELENIYLMKESRLRTRLEYRGLRKVIGTPHSFMPLLKPEGSRTK